MPLRSPVVLTRIMWAPGWSGESTSSDVIVPGVFMNMFQSWAAEGPAPPGVALVNVTSGPSGPTWSKAPFESRFCAAAGRAAALSGEGPAGGVRLPPRPRGPVVAGGVADPAGDRGVRTPGHIRSATGNRGVST